MVCADHLTQIAAALGRQFSHELISAVAAMPKQQLDDALAKLVRAELIFRRETPPDAEYTFKHALVQDPAYSTKPWKHWIFLDFSPQAPHFILYLGSAVWGYAAPAHYCRFRSD
jgi:hypothetical protein